MRDVIACDNKNQRNKPDVFTKLTRSYKEANESFKLRLDVDLRTLVNGLFIDINVFYSIY